jgi:uncharacterized protein YecE (DUF72 family)
LPVAVSCQLIEEGINSVTILKTPDGFIFSAKVPKVISHDKYIEGCEAEIKELVAAMSALEDKLGRIFPLHFLGK